MPQSSELPKQIQIDWGKLKYGTVDILVRWDILQSEIDGIEYYNYSERRLNWILPSPMTSKIEIQAYFDNNYDQGENILGWAMASKINESDLINSV